MSDRDARATLLEPGPVCLTIAPLLPVLDEQGMNAGDVAEARAHLATCAYCQAQRAIYDQLDRVLVRHFSPNAEPLAPIVVGQDLLAVLDEQPPIDLDDLPVFMPLAPVSVRRRGYAVGLASLAAVLVLSLLAGALFATHPHSHPANPAMTPIALPGSQNMLEHVSMVSADEGWAIGAFFPSNSDQTRDVVLHYTRGKWVAVNTDLPSGLTGIKMISATDGWIISLSVLAHYDGHSWQRVDTPPNGGLNAISVVSPTDIWVVGGPFYSSPRQPTILHYDGIRWTLVPVPQAPDDFFELNSISMVSANEGWAAGVSEIDGGKGAFPRKGVILHYISGSWHIAQVLPNTYLWDVGMVSPTDGWAMGVEERLVNSEIVGGGTLWWRYHEGRWVRAALPASIDPQPQSVSTLMPADHVQQLWAIGSMLRYEGDPGEMPYEHVSMVLRYANGTWTKLPDIPVLKNRRDLAIMDISFVAPDEFWAVGSSVWWTGQPIGSSNATQDIVTPLILHYKDGIWTAVAS